MSKKTLSALIAGCMFVQGFTGLFGVSDKENEDIRSDSQMQNSGEIMNTGGWYSNKALRGHKTRERIINYMS